MRMLVLIAALLSGALPAAAQSAASDPGIAVIVAAQGGPDIQFDRVTLRDIFLKRIVIDRSGRLLVPANLAPSDPLRRAFSQSLLARAPQALQEYWNNRYFQGVTPPYVLGSQEAVVRFVSATPGAVGYVAPCYIDTRVRVVLRLPLAAEQRDTLRGACPQR